ncbi:MAG: RNA polymerase sigma factor [Vicinamibacterales bacterium]
MVLSRLIEDIVSTDGRRVLAGLIRLTGDFDAAEDALQEAYARAVIAWQRDGVPDRPGAWLNTVARRVAIDRLRQGRTSDLPADLAAVEVQDEEQAPDVEDDRLRLLFVCCHPALPPDARSALALRTLGGLSTREIARAFVEPEATTAQRLVRAKKKIRDARIPFESPSLEKLPERLDAVLSVLYLMFNEGYTSTDADSLIRPDLAREAIRLGRLAVELLPRSMEARGLLALMLLTDARRGARITGDGELVPLERQDRTLWDRAQIDEGVRILDDALARGEPGPYQIQAAIAALHATAAASADTDWLQIALLYDTLLRWLPTPVVELNAAVAHGMTGDLERALDRLLCIEQAGALSRYHLLHASKAEILRRLGRYPAAADSYRDALALVTNPSERRHLHKRLRELSAGPA